MKKLLSLLLVTFIFIHSEAQQVKKDEEVNLDVLKAPTSPALNLLGVSPSSIERPTDIPAFLVSLQNGTSNFTSFPKNYAVEFAPWLVFKKTGNTLDKFNSTSFKDVFQQTFQFSLGVSQQNMEGETSDDSSSFTRSGFGIKFSLIRQKWSAQTDSNFEALQKAQLDLLNELDNGSLREAVADLETTAQSIRDSLMVVNMTMPSGEEKTTLLRKLILRLKDINQTKNLKQNELVKLNAAYEDAKRVATSFKVERKPGLYLDFASGLVVDFPDRRFSYSEISNAGAWLTGGYDAGNNALSVLGIIRYLYQPDRIFADEKNVLQTKDLSTLDAGAKLLLNAMKGRFTLSGEALYRSVLKKDLIDPSWRLVLNVEYDIGLNQKLTFAFGRNFDGIISRGGNLITALNFIKGFGASKKITGQH